jgi:hypothetical protein
MPFYTFYDQFPELHEFYLETEPLATRFPDETERLAFAVEQATLRAEEFATTVPIEYMARCFARFPIKKIWYAITSTLSEDVLDRVEIWGGNLWNEDLTDEQRWRIEQEEDECEADQEQKQEAVK